LWVWWSYRIELDHDINLGGYEKTICWSEQLVQFDKSDLQHAAFRSMLNQFHKLVDYNIRDYGGYVDVWSNAEGVWDSQYLGPVVQGKIASNECWYIYFEK